MNQLIKSTILNTDSYKPSQWVQYPPNTTYIRSYIESRGGLYNKTVFVGLQYIIKEYLMKPITKRQIAFAKKVWALHGEPFNEEGWNYILNVHGGRLPIRIRAVKEGAVIPTKNALVVVENTDPNCYWLTSYIETMLLRLWYPITVASQSYAIREVIYKYMVETGSDMAGFNFMLHDFGSRGVSSLESAGIGDLGHLAVGWMGTDTITGALTALEYYTDYDFDADDEEFSALTPELMFGFSVPASEHSTITSWERVGELNAYRNMIEKYGKPGAIFSVVSDSYNIDHAVNELWGKQLRDEVLACGGRLVVRPDSGNPADVVLRCVQALDLAFGSTVNARGFKVLNPSVRVIQGDGINLQSVDGILMCLKAFGYAAENVVFGMGGALLQHVDRDTQKMAMKCSAAKVDDRWVDVFKDPITDPGKTSKKGRIELFRNSITGEFKTLRVEEATDEWINQMVDVFVDGDLTTEYTFPEVRSTVQAAFEAQMAVA
jgi:nicotinamide phosphoribosyltransferase